MLTEIMISINPPYSSMIMSGEKTMEFRKKILNVMREYEECKLYFYETKNGGGSGKVIGEAMLLAVYEVHYADGLPDSSILVKTRFRCIKELYLNWCNWEKHPRKPNMNEGWFKSKRFKKYREKIGWDDAQNFNYALEVSNVLIYDKQKDLSEFCTLSGEPLTFPPQNMFRCRTC